MQLHVWPAQDIMHINMEITKALEKMQSLDAILEKNREREEMVKSESKKQWKMREDKQVVVFTFDVNYLFIKFD